jgi:hypothetical protein
MSCLAEIAGADTESIGLDGRTLIAAIQWCEGWCGLKNISRTGGPAGGISAEIAAIR